MILVFQISTDLFIKYDSDHHWLKLWLASEVYMFPGKWEVSHHWLVWSVAKVSRVYVHVEEIPWEIYLHCLPYVWSNGCINKQESMMQGFGACFVVIVNIIINQLTNLCITF